MFAATAVGKRYHGCQGADHAIMVVHGCRCTPGAIWQLIFCKPCQRLTTQLPVHFAQARCPGCVVGSAGHMTRPDLTNKFRDQVCHEWFSVFGNHKLNLSFPTPKTSSW